MDTKSMSSPLMDNATPSQISLAVLSQESCVHMSLDEQEASVERGLRSVHMVAEILKRDTVGEFKQVAMDRWRVSKDLQLCVASLSCLAVIFIQNIIIWKLCRAKDLIVTTDEYHLWIAVLIMDIVKGVLTVLSLVFLTQYYSVLYKIKKEKWLAVLRQTPADGQKDTEERSTLREQEYVRQLLWRYIGEVVIHLILPFEFMARSSVAYQMLLLGSFLRIYLVFRLLHTSSAAFRRRAQIRSQYQDFRRMNLMVSWGLTIKILFYKYMWSMLSVAALTILIVLAFVIFVFERDEVLDNPKFQSLGNCIYFAFVTFSTIGYGDMVPKSTAGKGVTVLLGVLGHVMSATFGGIVTNKLAPSKTQQLVTEYLENQDAQSNYRHAAATLIQSVWRVWGRKRLRMKHINRLPTVGAAAALGSVTHDKKKHEDRRELVFAAVKKFRNRRYLLAKSSLQAIDSVVDQKLDTMSTTLEAHSDVLNRLLKAIEGADVSVSPRIAAGSRKPSLFSRRMERKGSAYDNTSSYRMNGRKGSSVGIGDAFAMLANTKERSSSEVQIDVYDEGNFNNTYSAKETTSKHLVVSPDQAPMEPDRRLLPPQRKASFPLTQKLLLQHSSPSPPRVDSPSCSSPGASFAPQPLLPRSQTMKATTLL